MIYQYEMINKKEVFGNYTCNLRFLCDNIIIYSKDIYYHELNALINMDLQSPLFVLWQPSVIGALVFEYRRNQVSNFVLLNFLEKKTYTLPLLKNLTINDNIINSIINEGDVSPFVIESIKSPFFAPWEISEDKIIY